MLILAHRGAHQPETPGVSENTLDAFRAAADLGVDGIELDVRRTADGVLVVHHDAVLPDGRAVSAVVSGHLPAHVPTLDAALAVCAPLRLVDVEAKNSPIEPGFDPSHRLAEGVAAALAADPWQNGSVWTPQTEPFCQTAGASARVGRGAAGHVRG